MDQQALNSAQVRHMMAAMIPLIGVFVLVGVALIIVPLWIALKKAGLAPALSLIALIPTFGVIVVLFILAFARWKVVPAPEYGASYPPQYPPTAFPPVTSGYTAPGAYTPAQSSPVYPPAQPGDPRNSI